MKKKWLFVQVLFFLSVFLYSGSAGSQEYSEYGRAFKNFITCELTRTDAVNHFEGKPFSITMIDLFGIQEESGMVILTGAVLCDVQGKTMMLYPAVGVETIFGEKNVSYFTIRPGDYSILATELYRFPYKERCPWARYWIDTD